MKIVIAVLVKGDDIKLGMSIVPTDLGGEVAENFVAEIAMSEDVDPPYKSSLFYIPEEILSRYQQLKLGQIELEQLK